MKNVLFIIGSTSNKSANFLLANYLVANNARNFNFQFSVSIDLIPHFSSDISEQNIQKTVAEFHTQIDKADAVIICTPEYVFSLPGSLKNALEWCVGSLVFANKHVGLITAATLGGKAHEQLQLIMNTMGAKFTANNTMLINGIKAKFDADGNIIDQKMIVELKEFMRCLV